MCGFCGFLTARISESEAGLKPVAAHMADTLAHRGPDDSGAWADAEAGIALAHRRLSIIDLSRHGHQPMASRDGRYVIAYNGEIYNFQALRDELTARGHTFQGHSDTEALLAAICEWGVPAALRGATGMFAFALWDRQARALYLARDRMGEKPLYYGWAGDTFLFGSELKALRRHPVWRGGVDRDALALMLRYNYVPAPWSIHPGIRKLEPGQYLRLAAGRREPSVEAYWSLPDVAQAGQRDPAAGSEASLDELEGVLKAAVDRQMVADVPLGAFVSGGIDSSTVTALMQAQSMQPVKTFTIGFHEAGYNEAEHAKAVARHLGTDHTELYVTSAQARDVIPSLPMMYDEPFADSSQIPTFLVAQLARQHVTVSLSGDGGDELFHGYNRHMLAPKLWRVFSRLPGPLRQCLHATLTRIPVSAWNVVLSGLDPLLPASKRGTITGGRIHRVARLLRCHDPAELYQTLVSLWPEPEAVVLGSNPPITVARDPAIWGCAESFNERMMLTDALTYLPDDILVKVDRAAMAVSLETRVPLLDHHVVEAAWRTPLDMKYRNGQSKWALRQILYKYVPRELIERPKMGFGLPIDTWLRGPLRDWAETLLDESRLRQEGYLDPAPIRQKWHEHLSGRNDWQHHLWGVLMFQAWLEQNPN